MVINEMNEQYGESSEPDLSPNLLPDLGYEPEIEIFSKVYDGNTKLVIIAHMNEDRTLEYFTYDCYIHMNYNRDTGVTRWDGKQGADSLEEALIGYCGLHKCDIESFTEELISVFDAIRKNADCI